MRDVEPEPEIKMQELRDLVLGAGTSHEDKKILMMFCGVDAIENAQNTGNQNKPEGAKEEYMPSKANKTQDFKDYVTKQLVE